MSVLVWDEIGDRLYETGLDRGVLYLPDGSAIPWNGLVSISESSDREIEPTYYDGMKIHDLVSLGSFSGIMRAITYPEEFLELEGLGELRSGVSLGDQKPKTFGLSYRTKIGNDLVGDDAGYKIHILYNVIAVPNDKSYSTNAADPSLVEFEWNITATPEEVVGFHPTAHFIISSMELTPELLDNLEEILYGSVSVTASLPSISELFTLFNSFYIIEIFDNGDGTWTATPEDDADIVMLDADTFEIHKSNSVMLDADTFQISTTLDEDDIT